ncbi:MAG: hypothetical protein KU37_08645 [Sulfuricurvum sp. PC08-66]|nr:MAG: hypothetical protein KU37_08645 [Sulfuricurvum sp. PC08-66]
MLNNTLFILLSHWVVVGMLGLYVMTNMQWYSYKINRVILHHHKVSWHLLYFVLPFAAYHLVAALYFWVYLYVVALPLFVVWYRKLDKPLQFTWRVRRFFMVLALFTAMGEFICYATQGCAQYPLFFPLVFALGVSHAIERFLFVGFQKEAIAKLERMKNMKVVAITGSYGKTSMKNFIVQLLSKRYKVYATPGNVNTYAGIVRDINTSLPNDTQIYIVEAGARERGDILEIAQLVEPHIAVVGKVGPQHIEYFKTLDNIIRTKLELIQSRRLEKAFVHASVTNEPHELVTFFGENISNVTTHLGGISFDVTLDKERFSFHSKVLGSFQAINITAAIMVARFLRVDMDKITQAVETLHPVPHRLERIDTGLKTILDDSYNSNFEGMMEAIALAAEFQGRKVIVTPGLVESTTELNHEVAMRINEVFDVVIITGKLNAALYDTIIEKPFKILLGDKSHLEQILQNSTQEGDLILFANDAPNFI